MIDDSWDLNLCIRKSTLNTKGQYVFCETTDMKRMSWKRRVRFYWNNDISVEMSQLFTVLSAVCAASSEAGHGWG